MDKRTPPSHIPCSDLVSQTRMFYLVFIFFDSGQLWTWLSWKAVSCSRVNFEEWHGFDGRIANPGLSALIKARGTPGKSSQQGIPVGSSGVGLILVAVLIPNVPDRLH